MSAAFHMTSSWQSLKPALTYASLLWAEIRDSPRSWCEQRFLKDLGNRSPGATGCTCDVLPQLAAVAQLGDYIRGLQCPSSVGCVSSGSQHHQVACCVFLFELKSELSVCECVRLFSFGQFPYILFSDSHFTFGFWVQCFCSSIILKESVGGCVFYSHRHSLGHRGISLLWPFCDLCSAL